MTEGVFFQHVPKPLTPIFSLVQNNYFLDETWENNPVPGFGD
jgi:hypothetical protein